MAETTLSGDSLSPMELNAAEIELTIRWFSQAASFSEADDDRVHQALGVREDGVRGKLNKNLYSSKLKVVKDVAAAKAAVLRWRDMWTIPMAATFAAAGEERTKSPGRRLILVKHLSDFFQGLDRLEQDLLDAVQRLQDAMPEVKEDARQRLRDKYDPSDYPSDLVGRVKVMRSAPRTVQVHANLESLAPKEFENARQQLRQQLEQSVMLHIAEFSTAMIERLELLSRQLRRVVTVHPTDDYAEYAGHEEMLVRGDSYAGVPEGMVQVTLYEPKSRSRVELPPMTIEEYRAKLRPRATDVKRQLHASSFTEIETLLVQFQKTADLVGERGATTKMLLGKLQQELKNVVGSAEGEDAAKRVKNLGVPTRERLSGAINDVLSGFAAQAKEINAPVGGRRVVRNAS